MPQSKYAADIEAIKLTQVESAVAQAENAIVLRNIAKWQTETLAEVRDMAQCMKRHDRELVALETWRVGHRENHTGLTNDVDGLRKRINTAATANALWSPVASIIAVIFGQQN